MAPGGNGSDASFTTSTLLPTRGKSVCAQQGCWSNGCDGRFTIDCIAHLALSAMFSYVVLDNMQDSLSGLEILALIWFVSLLVEELRQMDFGWRWREYAADPWNR